MPNGQFIQLLTALAGIQSDRERARMSQEELDMKQQQFKEYLKQSHGQEVQKAMDTIMKLAPRAREAFLQLQGNFAPEEMQAFRSIITAQPIDPAVLGAQSAQAGYAAAVPDQRAQLDAEAAARATTGMNMGQVASSGLQSAVNGGAIPQGLQNTFTADMIRSFVQGSAQRLATGQTPFDAATQASAMGQGLAPGFAQNQYGTKPTQYGALTPPQAANVDIGRGGVQAQFAAINQRAIEAAQAAGMKGLEALSSGQGGLSSGNMTEMLLAIPKILDDMQNPRATKEANETRKRMINSLAATLGMPALMFKGTEADVAVPPLWGQFLNKNFGANQVPLPPAQAQPTYTPPQAPQAMQPMVQPQAPGLPMNPFQHPPTLAPFFR